MKVRYSLFVLGLVCGLSSPASAGEAEPRALIENGGSLGRIVITAQASRAERFAAEELQVYLARITGVQVPIASTLDVGSGPAVVVGRHPANAALIRELKARYPIVPGSWKTAGNYDAFAVVCDGRRLHLVGNAPDATLYAAWDWLESLGVRWIMPGPHGTYVPSRKAIALSPVEKYEGPGMAFRGPRYSPPARQDKSASTDAEEHGVDAGLLYSLRHRVNLWVSLDGKGEWGNLGSGHSYMHLLPKERYYKDHPEWFNLINGRRAGSNPWQVCFTNEAAAREFARNSIAAIKTSLARGHVIERIRLCVSPNDGRAWCECEPCRNLVDKDGSATSLVVYFANNVAREVRKVYPQARISFYAYDNYARPGDHVRPGPGVTPELVFWTANTAVGANHAQPMFSDANPKFRDYFKQWTKFSDAISAHEYYGHYNWFTPWPKLTQMATDIPRLAREPKFYGMYSESHLHWGTQAPNFYLQLKLMWNPDLDVGAVMDDYYQKAFGPAGPHVQRYFEILQKRMDSLPYICGYLTEVPSLLTPEVVARCNAFMDQAQALLSKMDADTRWRTDLVIQAWRMSAKTAEAMRLRINPRPQPGDGGRILKLIHEVQRFMETEQGRWAFEYGMAKAQLETLRVPLSSPLGKLPKGTTTYNDHLGYGGTVKFFGTIKGFEPGLWGYSLRPGGSGTIDLPLTAIPGGKITAATLELTPGNLEGCNVQVGLMNDEGRIHLVAEGLGPCRRVAIAPNHLGGSKITLRIQAKSTSDKAQIVLCAMNLSVTVE